MKYFKLLLILLLFKFTLADTSAQISVTGTVIDEETAEPLESVTVIVAGTLNGTSTSADGRFELDVASEDITEVNPKNHQIHWV